MWYMYNNATVINSFKPTFKNRLYKCMAADHVCFFHKLQGSHSTKIMFLEYNNIHLNIWTEI